MALTDAKIRTAKPKDKPYRLADAHGLHIYVSPSGGKLWRLKYRYNKKEKLLSFGKYPVISLQEAREKRIEALKILSSGQDPSEVHKAQKLAKKVSLNNSFELVAREWLASYMKGKAESHKSKVTRRLEIYFFPWIGNKPISEITAPILLEVIRRIESQNKLDTAHRALQNAGQVFRYAVQTGRAQRDISADLKGALPPVKTRHMAAFTEPKDVAALLRAIEAFNGTFIVQSALRLLPLVFTRPSELRHAKWQDIDLESGMWKYTVSKTNTDHIVPLSRQALEILYKIKPVSGHNEYVFTGGHSSKRPMSESAINAALKRMGYDTRTQITAHGFRAMARTLLHERLNIDPNVIEHQLAHRVPDTLGAAYNRTKFLEQRKEMMQLWADYLDDLKQTT